MMKNYDESVDINHNPNWSYIPDYLYRILIIAGSKSGKTNAFLNLIKNQQPGLDKIYWCIKDPFKSKYNCILMEEKK